MQDKVKSFVKKYIDLYNLKDKKCLDIGSLDVNGSVSDLFSNYTGLDMREGNNVDIVANSHELPFKEEFEVITCLETLEHDDNPFQTLEEIHRVLKLEGYVIITASGISFPKHAYPNDYFRYTSEGLKALMKKFEIIEAFEDNDEAYAIAKK